MVSLQWTEFVRFLFWLCLCSNGHFRVACYFSIFSFCHYAFLNPFFFFKFRIIVILKNEKYSKIELFGKNQNNSKFWFSKIELF